MLCACVVAVCVCRVCVALCGQDARVHVRTSSLGEGAGALGDPPAAGETGVAGEAEPEAAGALMSMAVGSSSSSIFVTATRVRQGA